jgi:hypothetical protein
MKKLMQLLGLMSDYTVHLPASNIRHNPQILDLPAFTAWCNELNVSILAPKNAEFTITIGNHVKHVRLERDSVMNP